MTIADLKAKGFDCFFMFPDHAEVLAHRARLMDSGIEYEFAETTEEVAHIVLHVLATHRLTPTFKAILTKRAKTVRDFIGGDM